MFAPLDKPISRDLEVSVSAEGTSSFSLEGRYGSALAEKVSAELCDYEGMTVGVISAFEIGGVDMLRKGAGYDLIDIARDRLRKAGAKVLCLDVPRESLPDDEIVCKRVEQLFDAMGFRSTNTTDFFSSWQNLVACLGQQKNRLACLTTPPREKFIVDAGKA